MGKEPTSQIIEYGTNDLLWCEEHGRYEQFSTLVVDGVVTEQVSHRPVLINLETGLPCIQVTDLWILDAD